MNTQQLLKTMLLVIIIFPLYYVYADVPVVIYPDREVVLVKPQSKACAIIHVQLPQKGYIYANPKGEGTGKATIAVALSSPPIIPKNTRYLPGIFYISPLDRKPVYIYKNQTSLCIPFEVHTIKEGTYLLSITVEALFCDDVSCTPIRKTIAQTIKVDTSAPEFDTSVCERYMEPQHIPINKDTTASLSNFKVIETASSSLSILQAVVFGIIAGFLLNFMPCVLPVISLKIMSFISHGNNNPRSIQTMGVLFTAGILTSFVVLASLAAFAGYNWGQLFQHQMFVIIMAAIIFALALSFFGVFTFNIPNIPQLQSTNVYLDSYFKGIIATLLATPCSGPFLGATLAWSLTQHPVIIFMVFINIGLGMSLPYIVLSFYPSLVRFIPKPGDWMIAFEQFMGFLLVGTTIYLITLLDFSLLTKSLWFILVLSVALWQWGRYGNITKPVIQRIISLVLLVILVIISSYLLFFYQKKGTANDIIYKSFNWEAIVSSKNSQISMVVFTADWCPNCKFVEATALASSDVINFIHANNIKVYKADITTKNEQAENILQSLGSRSIPFVAIFPQGENFLRPVILRDIYTANDLLKALQKAAELSQQSTVPHIIPIP
ncbi:MAG: thioredoxin family protein [Spirochaetes bacterium]|nr:thioredoxin family protein [Spirochaetota bacterium]